MPTLLIADTSGMATQRVVIERCTDTDILVGYVPRIAGAHSQADTSDELAVNLQEVLDMLAEDDPTDPTSSES